MGRNLEITEKLQSYIDNFSLKLNSVQQEIINYNNTLGDIKRMQVATSQCHFLHLIIKISKIKNVLEIGSGRGGGAAYIAKYLQPEFVTGIDISEDAISLCHDLYSLTNLNFVIGDSENIPLSDNTYDIVINVESSHCYGDMEKFLSEVYRVLKPDGSFLFCDFRTLEGIDELNEQFSKSNLKFLNRVDITENVIEGLNRLSEYRESHIQKSVPFLIQSLFKTYAGIKGTEIYNSFITGKMIYSFALLKK